jgi:hypothetical protein
LKQQQVEALRKNGFTVVTEVDLVLAGPLDVTARIDAMVRSPEGAIFGMEYKTGDNPRYSDAQRIVYPHAIFGQGVSSPNNKITELALTPGVPLPPFEIIECYASGPGVKLKYRNVLPQLFLEKLRQTR